MLTVGQVTVGEAGVDPDLVLALGQPLQHVVAQAETPVLRVVGGAVGDEVGLLGQCVQMRAQFVQRHRGRYRHAVAHHVQGLGPDLMQVERVVLLIGRLGPEARSR